MSTKITPYIGITGFTSKKEVEELIKEIPDNFSRKLMVGVLISYNTMRYKTPTGRYARVEDVKNIFLEDPRIINLIHYCDKDKTNVLENLERLIERADTENLHGFQLNMPWPALQIVRAFKEKYPDQKIVLQMERNDFDMTPGFMADCLSLYNEYVEYVILDMSMGKGIQMNPNKLMQYAREIQKINNMHIVFAGGLKAGNMKLLKPLIKEFPNMSIDAEGKLMDPRFDVLDVDKCKEYLQGAIKLFN